MDPSSQFLARKALQTIIDAFKDPHCPSYCEVVLLGCFATLKNYACTPLHYPYFDAIMAFLSAPRSAIEINQLKTTMTCRCRHDPKLNTISIRAMHARASKEGIVPDATPPAFEVFMSTLFATIETALECALKQGGSLYKTERRHRRVQDTEGVLPWPLHPTALTPHGPEDSVRGLIRWSQTERYLQSSVVNLVRQLVQGCNRQVIPYVVNSHTLLNALMEHLENGYVGWNDPTNDSQYHNHTAAMKRLKQGAQLVDYIFECTDSVERATFAQTCDHDKAALRFCNGAIHWAASLTTMMSPLADRDKSDLEFIHETFVQLGGTVYASYTAHSIRPVRPHNEIIVQAHTLKLSNEEPWMAAFTAMKELTSSERCANAACTKTFAEYGRKFKHCSGCWRAPYCSVACQADAWEDPAVPHREVCHMIEELCVFGGLPRKVVEEDRDRFFDPDAPAYLHEYAKVIKVHWKAISKERATRAAIGTELEWERVRDSHLQRHKPSETYARSTHEFLSPSGQPGYSALQHMGGLVPVKQHMTGLRDPVSR